MSAWFSIEVLDGASTAALWGEAFADAIVESALQHGAHDWSWHRHSWGIVFEVELDDEAHWESFRRLTAVQVALDAVPDPVGGLILYRGRGGSAGTPVPRRPRPLIGSGAAALPLPWDLALDDRASLSSLVGPRPAPLASTSRLR